PPPPAPLWPAAPPGESAAASSEWPVAPPTPGPPSSGCRAGDEQALAPAPASRASRNRRRVAEREGNSDDRGRDMRSLPGWRRLRGDLYERRVGDPPTSSNPRAKRSRGQRTG